MRGNFFSAVFAVFACCRAFSYALPTTERPPEFSLEFFQGDQPQNDSEHLNTYEISQDNDTQVYNATAERLTMMRERQKQQQLDTIKQNIQMHTGHFDKNSKNFNFTDLNIFSIIKNYQSDNNVNDEQTSEKIYSYFPSCEYPKNTDEEAWNNKTEMNLFFNISTENSIKSSAAFIRLYRIFKTNITSSLENNEERLIRISVYFYVKPLKKNSKPKKRLSDSIVIDYAAPWVELNIKPILNYWAKGRNKNMGITIRVDDQEENFLKPSDVLKGLLCTIGSTTPIPIPAIVLDATIKNHEPRIPSIDICYAQNADNDFRRNISYDTSKSESCRSMKLRQPASSLQEFPTNTLNTGNPRHIRHSHHFHQRGFDDPRSKIQNSTIIWRHSDRVNLNITAHLHR